MYSSTDMWEKIVLIVPDPQSKDVLFVRQHSVVLHELWVFWVYSLCYGTDDLILRSVRTSRTLQQRCYSWRSVDDTGAPVKRCPRQGPLVLSVFLLVSVCVSCFILKFVSYLYPHVLSRFLPFCDLASPPHRVAAVSRCLPPPSVFEPCVPSLLCRIVLFPSVGVPAITSLWVSSCFIQLVLSHPDFSPVILCLCLIVCKSLRVCVILTVTGFPVQTSVWNKRIWLFILWCLSLNSESFWSVLDNPVL